MAKDPSPLLGYNNNIRHKNRVFHIQTEDSGVRHPHIITHLFMDGGRILKSVKTSYAEHLGVEKMADLVRKMMKDQHKGMLIALRDGQFDQVIDGGEASKPALKAAPSAEVEAPAAPPPAPPPPPEPVASPVVVAAEKPSSPSVPPARAPASVRAPGPASVRPAALMRGDLDSPTSRPFEGAASDLEPPPANLFRPRTGGNYSTLVAPSDADTRSQPGARGSVRPPAAGRPATVPPGATLSRSAIPKAPPPPPQSPSRPSSASASASPPRQTPIRRTSSPPAPPVAPTPANRIVRRPGNAPVVATKAPESRYASARPAAIFGQSRPRGGSSIFGEDIISDKSLDEVIMSYLADDAKEGTSKPSAPPSTDRKGRK
jgi:hypothetical protein